MSLMREALWNRLKKKAISAICSSLVIYFPLLIGHSNGLLNPNQIPVTCEVDLAHWGLNDPSEIGYVSLGILHKESGDELRVYDIREERPRIKEPSMPKSQIPPFRDHIFLVDDFQQGNVNRLGGYFSAFFKSPSESRITIETSLDGSQSLCFSYHQKPSGFAGFWIHLFNFKAHPVDRVFLDASPFRYLTFTIRGEEGDERLMLQVADYSWEKREDSVEIGSVERFLASRGITKDWQRVWIPLEELPENLNRQELASLVFLVRSGNGRISIGDIAFTTRKKVRIPSAREEKIHKPSLHRAMWLWETKEVLGNDQSQDRLLDFCRKCGITEIFLQLPYEKAEKEGIREIIWDRSKVRSLLLKLHSAEIRIHALDGDPRFALSEWQDHVVATIQSVVQFNKSVKPDERFDGIRYDNEPYLLPNFAGVQKESILKQYMSFLRISKSMTESAGLEFGVDIPFWFDQKNEFFEPITELEERPLTEHILDIVDNIGIMDYRTEAYGADGVIVHALGELGYASKKGKKVFVGLETTDVPDETILEFGRGKENSGILLQKSEGTKILLQWIPELGGTDPKSGNFLFLKKKTFIPSGKLTFKDKNARELAEVMEKAESEFRRFPSFRGFAIHQYKSYQLLQQE
jgi:hypothetical protein